MQIINLPNDLLLIRQIHERPFPASFEFYAYEYCDEHHHLYANKNPLAPIIPADEEEEEGGGGGSCDVR